MSNFWLRTLTGIVFLVVMVFGLIWDRTLFGALFVVVLWVALQEFYRMALGTRFLFQQKRGSCPSHRGCQYLPEGSPC